MDEIIAKIMLLITQLDPSIALKYSDVQMLTFIEIALTIVGDDAPEGKQELAVALLTLDLLSTPDRSNTTSKTIGGVSISYASGASTSKWRTLYDNLMNEYLSNDQTLHYTGI